MRASSSWIKLQFVVRKHVMNTYQMHTLTLFLFYHIFSIILCPVSDFLSFWLYPPPSLRLIPSVFLMVCHIDVTYSAVLYNIPPYMYMCMHMCIFIFLGEYICDMYLRVLCVSVILLLLFVLSHLHFRPLARAVDNWVQTCPLVYLLCVCMHLVPLSLTLSLASVEMSSFAGCSGVGLAHWSEQEDARIHSDSNELHVPPSEVTTHLGLWGEKEKMWEEDKRKEQVMKEE